MKKSNFKEIRNRMSKTRLTEEEYQSLQQKKKACGVSESEFIRRAIENAPMSANNANKQQIMMHICQIQTMLNKARITLGDAIIDEIQQEVSDLCRCL